MSAFRSIKKYLLNSYYVLNVQGVGGFVILGMKQKVKFVLCLPEEMDR